MTNVLRWTGVWMGAMTCLGLAGAASAAGPEAAPAIGRPNVVIILADDLGWGDVSAFHPSSKIRTPHIDRLVAQGLRFTDAHSSAAVCTPSRYGLLTGRYCWRTWLKRNVVNGYSPMLIQPGQPTLPGLFKNHGYATACIGKWHLGLDWTLTDDSGRALSNGKNVDFSRPVRRGPNDCGFDYSFITAACSKIDAPHVFIENGKCTVLPTRWYVKHGPGKDNTARTGFADPDFPFRHVDETFVKQARRFITVHKDRPFFVYLALSAPHAPFWPPDWAEGKTISRRGDLVYVVDWCVGQITETLEDLDLANRTIVLFASDNGPREEQTGHDPSGPFRGLKSHIWEGGHRIPLVVRWPGIVKPGTRTDQPIELNDLFATFADLLGARLPAGAAPDSFSMLAVLRGQPLDRPLRPFLIHHSCFGVFAIRRPPWKLIFGTKGSGGWVVPGDSTTRRGVEHPFTIGQLYDMAADPYETTDLYEKRPDVVKALTDLFQRLQQADSTAAAAAALNNPALHGPQADRPTGR